MMEKLKPLLPLFLLFVASIVALVAFFPNAHPYGGVSLPLTASQILDRSRAVLEFSRIDATTLGATRTLQVDAPLLCQAQDSFGLARSNELVRDSIPAYQWNVRWNPRDRSPLRIRSGESSDKQVEAAMDLLKGEISMRFDTRGRLLQFERKLPDSAYVPTLSQTEAKLRLLTFMKQYTPTAEAVQDTSRIVSTARIERPKRTDYKFTITTISPVLHNPVTVTAVISGNAVSSLVPDAHIPDRYSSRDRGTALSIILVLFYTAIGIAMVVVAFRRIRSYEIGFRIALMAGVFVAVVYGIEFFLTTTDQMGWEILIPLIVAPLFLGGGLVLVWAVSESIVRETWKEKFVGFDLISKGYVLQPRVGVGLLRGIFLGVIGFAVWTALCAACSSFTHLWYVPGDESVIHLFSVSAVWLYALGHGFYTVAYPFAFFILFAVSLLRRWITSPALLVIVAGLILGLLLVGRATPFVPWLVVYSCVGALAVWSFYRYDGLTVYLAMVTFMIVEEIAGLLVSGSGSLATSGFTLIGLIGVLMIIGTAALFRREDVSDFDAIAPAFARYITERQRLQQELEIARTVQMSFLPKSNPTHYKLDIASRCAPALEVGGDYYDFIELEPTKLGVAVGDVSGKGTQAAFFMTLTKGFLRAIAMTIASPAATLKQVNKLFYSNVQRGVFISMVYAVFDTEARIVSLARAGHNPVIMRKTQSHDVQTVNPMGLALGLDAGDAFGRSIQEVSINFQPGDLFVFYTDGFPEAMNKTMEEFGEERLCTTVQKYAHGSAAEIMEGVFMDMKEFVGRAKQHDDMTIVVVKAME